MIVARIVLYYCSASSAIIGGVALTSKGMSDKDVALLCFGFSYGVFKLSTYLS